jgi:hypothetical protein
LYAIHTGSWLDAVGHLPAICISGSACCESGELKHFEYTYISTSQQGGPIAFVQQYGGGGKVLRFQLY